MDLNRAVPILSVEDLPKAIEAYTEVLGLEVLMNHDWIATLGSGGSAQLSLTTADATASENPTASLEVEDVDAAHAAAVAAGFEIVHPLTDEEWGVRRFFIRDADANVVNILSHRK
jgi:catechol 2,3-dioxygenase-like lactoylglutathione lyase family enzyme